MFKPIRESLSGALVFLSNLIMRKLLKIQLIIRGGNNMATTIMWLISVFIFAGTCGYGAYAIADMVEERRGGR